MNQKINSNELSNELSNEEDDNKITTNSNSSKSNVNKFSNSRTKGRDRETTLD